VYQQPATNVRPIPHLENEVQLVQKIEDHHKPNSIPLGASLQVETPSNHIALPGIETSLSSMMRGAYCRVSRFCVLVWWQPNISMSKNRTPSSKLTRKRLRAWMFVRATLLSTKELFMTA
jgi:hypothetical protein